MKCRIWFKPCTTAEAQGFHAEREEPWLWKDLPPAALWKVNMGSINPSRKSYRHDTSSAKAVRLISEQVLSRQPRPRPPPGGIMSQAMFGTSGAGAQRWLRPQTCWTDRLGWPDSEPYTWQSWAATRATGWANPLFCVVFFVFSQEAPFGSSDGGRVCQAGKVKSKMKEQELIKPGKGMVTF